MKYTMEFEEKISMWQTISIIFDTEDSIEDIKRHIADGDFTDVYNYDVTNINQFPETESLIEADFEQSSKKLEAI